VLHYLCASVFTVPFVHTVIMGPISCISSTSSIVQGMAYWLFQEPQQIAAAKQGQPPLLAGSPSNDFDPWFCTPSQINLPSMP